MPAKSKSQQRLMGMVYAYLDRRELPTDKGLARKVKEVAKGISKDEARKFAETKHGSGSDVRESHSITFKEFLNS